jgi:flagellar hook-associated protein 2
MASINFSGLGSGLDINTLVSQLVEAERSPTEKRINSAAAKINAQLSALGTLKSAFASSQSALEKLVSSADTPAFKTTIQDKAGFTANVGSTASAGKHEIEVLSLSKSHKLTSAAFAKDAQVGSGTLDITAGEQGFQVKFEQGATLAQIAAAINKATGGKGLSASVINADDGQHLVLNAAAAGTKGALQISASGGNGGLAALAFGEGVSGGMTETVAATDAQVRVDGFLRTSSSNSIGDLIPGVTLNLTEAKVGETFSLQVASDTTPFKTNLASFVSMFNAANSLMRSTSAYNAETRTASALTGDALIRGTQQQLRSLVGNRAAELANLGVTIGKDGTLSVDTAKTEKALAADPNAGAALFGKDADLATRLKSAYEGLLNTTKGSLNQRTDSLNKRIADLSDQVDALDRRMEKIAANYQAQFIAMDTLVAKLSSSSSFLASALAKLGNGTT